MRSVTAGIVREEECNATACGVALEVVAFFGGMMFLAPYAV
jgi:hypothetical protein